MVEKYKAKLTQEQRQRAVKLYMETDVKLEELAKMFGCSAVAIYKHVKKFKEEVNAEAEAI